MLSDDYHGLDVSVLGFIVAAVAFYAGRLGSAADVDSPNIIRFTDYPRGSAPPAVLPQDSALMLLTESDPSATESAASAAGPASVDPIWTLVMCIGFALLIGGPLFARLYVAEN
ncbi:hypothetical protein BRD01_08145 [Halobacteriales archaeon QS_8_65_32]|jgi:hypothetical protein|nr:MAG: hypothetical protein BRD01_08145 [Halobacteriales archaeon QS_8_65_32]